MATERKAAARFIFVTLFLDILGIGLVIPILPNLVTQFVGGDASEGAAYYGPLVAVYALMQFVASPALGALSDRFGRRPVLLFSMAGYGIDYLFMGFAPSLGWLVIGRMISGITGATVTTGAAYLADISTPETRSKNFGILGAAFGLGFIAGPALGGLLGAIGPRIPFFAAAAAVLINVAYGYFILPESLPPEHRRQIGWRDFNPFGAILALRKYDGIVGLAAAFVVVALAQRGFETLWVLYSNYRYGWEELQSGLSLALVGLSAAIVQGGLIRRVVPKLGERRVIIGGFVLAAAAQVGFGLSPVGWVFLLPIPIAALGGMAGPTLQGVVSGRVPRSEQGAVQGAFASLMSVTAVLAPLISTGVFHATTGADAPVEWPGAVFFLIGAFFVVGAVIATIALRGHQEPEHEPASAEPAADDSPVAS